MKTIVKQLKRKIQSNGQKVVWNSVNHINCNKILKNVDSDITLYYEEVVWSSMVDKTCCFEAFVK